MIKKSSNNPTKTSYDVYINILNKFFMIHVYPYAGDAGGDPGGGGNLNASFFPLQPLNFHF